MAVAMRSMGATVTLLMIILYIFGIIFAQQIGGSEDEELLELFGKIPKAMWTLLLAGTFLDNLTLVSEKLAEKASPILVALFLLFVLLAALTVLNMLIGVLVTVVSAVSSAEKE